QQVETPPQIHTLDLVAAPVPAPIPTGPLVKGEVTDANGKPVANAAVAILTGGTAEANKLPKADKPVWEGNADKDRQFQAQLPPEIVFNKSNELPIRVLASGSGAFGGISAIHKPDGPAIAVKLGNGKMLGGTVRGTGNKLMAGAKVRVWRIGPAWVRPSAD